MWDPSIMLKSYRWVGGWVAHEILVSAQGPSVLGFGPGLDKNTISDSCVSLYLFTCLPCACSDCLTENEDAVQCSGFSRCSVSVILCLFWSPGPGPLVLYKGVHCEARTRCFSEDEVGPNPEVIRKVMKPSQYILFLLECEALTHISRLFCLPINKLQDFWEK